MTASGTRDANLVFRMLHPAGTVRELGDALPVARAIAGLFDDIVPGSGWRSEGRDGPVATDALAALVIPNLTTVGDAGFSWSITWGSPPSDLFLQMTVGTSHRRTGGKARFRFDDVSEFTRLEQAYEAMSADPTTTRLHLSVGVEFLIRQQPEFDDQWRRLPPIGWRNWLRKPAPGPVDLYVPDWVGLRETPTSVEFILGPDPFSLDPAAAAEIRSRVMNAGLLGPEER